MRTRSPHGSVTRFRGLRGTSRQCCGTSQSSWLRNLNLHNAGRCGIRKSLEFVVSLGPGFLDLFCFECAVYSCGSFYCLGHRGVHETFPASGRYVARLGPLGGMDQSDSCCLVQNELSQGCHSHSGVCVLERDPYLSLVSTRLSRFGICELQTLTRVEARN